MPRAGPPIDIARAGVGRTFQNIRLFGQLSVFENVEFSALAPLAADRAGGEPQAFAWRLLAEMRLAELADRQAGDARLRRPAPARDRAGAGAEAALPAARRAGGRHEPDGIERAAARALAGCAQRYGIGLLVIDHDMTLIMRLCDRIVVLNRGQVIADGSARGDPARSRGHRGLYRPQARGGADADDEPQTANDQALNADPHREVQ